MLAGRPHSMVSDPMLDMVGQAGGPLAEASLWHLEVVDVSALGPDFRRMIMTAPGLDGLRYTAGQDLMFRVPRGDGAVTNRRYTIRRFDAARSEVIVDVSLHGAGPGTDWVRQAKVGDQIDAIGPRGKITANLEADWHLFVADDTGMPGALAMIDAISATHAVRAIFEVDGPEDEQEVDGLATSEPEINWIHRLGGSGPGDSDLLRQAVVELELPAGVGHAYIAAESAVVRDLQALLVERGLPRGQISAKGYWRRGLPNADHGEPVRQD
jgi:NADPH-dependent ferric siderophore reductase